MFYFRRKLICLSKALDTRKKQGKCRNKFQFKRFSLSKHIDLIETAKSIVSPQAVCR